MIFFIVFFMIVIIAILAWGSRESFIEDTNLLLQSYFPYLWIENVPKAGFFGSSHIQAHSYNLNHMLQYIEIKRRTRIFGAPPHQHSVTYLKLKAVLLKVTPKDFVITINRKGILRNLFGYHVKSSVPEIDNKLSFYASDPLLVQNYFQQDNFNFLFRLASQCRLSECILSAKEGEIVLEYKGLYQKNQIEALMDLLRSLIRLESALN